MSKNLITKPDVRKALIAAGNVTPADSSESHSYSPRDKAASQAAAIAARRKELGIKPVVTSKEPSNDVLVGRIVALIIQLHHGR